MSGEQRTYRRRLLDAWLTAHAHLLAGCVVDIGGKRTNKRGTFRPPDSITARWIYVNIDASTNPDLLADATAVPLPDGEADTILCAETLEHLAHPQAAVREMHRLLRPGGTLIASVPFLYPVHADPHDFQRFTAEGLRVLFAEFSTVKIMSMGGTWGTVAMLLELAARRPDARPRWWRALRRRVLAVPAAIAYRVDQSWQAEDTGPECAFTTGYGIIARK